MTRLETQEEVFTYFDDDERDAITAWLTARGKAWDQPTLCGSCCGFWDEEFVVTMSVLDVAAFNAFAAANGIKAVATAGLIKVGTPT